jgi:glutathione S-transferase
MALTLYFAAGSPPSRACLLLIRTLKLDVKVKHINLAAGEQNSPEFLKLNPLHKVPVLTDGDFVLTEGRAILGYLANKYSPGSDLYPSDPQKRARIDQRLYYDATVVFDCVAQIVVRKKERFLSERMNFLLSHFQSNVLFKRANKIPTELKDKVAETLRILESFLADSNGWFSGGGKVSIADISILPSVTTLKVRKIILL